MLNSMHQKCQAPSLAPHVWVQNNLLWSQTDCILQELLQWGGQHRFIFKWRACPTFAWKSILLPDGVQLADLISSWGMCSNLMVIC